MNQFNLLEKLQIRLWWLTCELNFVGSLIDTESTLEISGEELYLVVNRAAHQLNTAQRIVRRLIEAASEK